MKAQFEGRCGLCFEAIHEGDEIVCVEDEWCHIECAEDHDFDAEEELLEDEP